MFCQNCGTQHENTVKFCSDCGQPMQITETPKAQVFQASKPQEPPVNPSQVNLSDFSDGGINGGYYNENALYGNPTNQPYQQPVQSPYQPPNINSQYSNINQEQKSKLVAGLLGIFLGGFGVGRFYLGYTTLGVLQIVVTVFTAGIGALWGFIDGILILTGSVKFDAKGNPLKE